MTNARLNDPKLQEYHQEVTKAGESVNSLLQQLDVLLFKIPASEKELDKILLRLKNKPVDPRREEPRGEKSSGSSSTPASPRKGKKAGKRSVDSDDARLEGEEEEMDSSQPTELQDQVVVPDVVKKPRIPPFFVSPKGDWRQLVALANLVAPSFQSQMSGRFLKVTVGDELEYRNLSHWLEQSGVEFKSFMLKQDRPVKVVIRGLPSNTEPEDIKNEIEAEGLKVAKISQMKNYRTKAPMPLFYLQIENGADAPKIFNFTELFGTRIEVKPFDRGNKINQCWRCQGWFHSSEVCHLPPRCVRCAGPHLAKDCTRSFDEPMKCANCSGEHAANWSRLTFPAHVRNSLKIGFWNANSLRNKIHEVRDFVIEQNFDLFLVQETWLEPGIDPQIANYCLFKDDRIEFPHTVTRGGTAIYCKNEIVHNRVPLPATQGIDATAVQIKIKNAPPLNIVSAYIRRNVRSRFPSEDFKKIFNSGSNCIIAGDFNATHVDWHNAKNTRYGVMLRNLVSNLREVKLVAPQTATHLQPRQRFGSIIDLAVFKHIPYNHSIRVLSDLSSDHYPVILEINLNTSLIKNPEQLSTNWNNFKFALNKKPLPTTDLTSNENIELAISELNQNFSEAFVEASKPKFKNVPKILSPDIKSKIHQRNRLRKFRQRSRCPSIYSEFRTLSRALGSTAITPIEKAEVIADSLQEQFEPNHVADREEFDQRIHEEVANFLATPHVQEIEPTTPTEVLTYVQRIKPKKSPGLDQITNRMIKNLPLKFLLFITLLINQLFKNNYFPDSWKTAVVIPILKPDKNPELAQNYRPISLLSSLSKVYEFVLLRRLNQHCAASNMIIPQQCGFRPKCSTVHQLLRVTELIHSGFAKHDATGIFFLDIAKAFDKIWHDGLLIKLIRLDFPAPLIKSIHSFLTHRSFRVRVDRILSSPRPIRSGLPQGSLSLPLLFTLYVNDIPQTDSSHLAMFADDTAVIFRSIRPRPLPEIH
ncbi:probable RNA-directed DNA polymerase from transposon X-element [Trichonephila clavipes]|nr:probable RNA-directed DNA polymerase from transposon X-element [Trichonephila clavipes]